MSAFLRWALGILCALIGSIAALILARSLVETIVLYGVVFGVGIVGVAILWIATLGARRNL